MESGSPGEKPLDLREVIAHMSEGVQVIGPDYAYLYVNEAAARHGQSSVPALLRRKMTEVYPGIDETAMFSHLERVMTEGGTHRMENEFEFVDGATRWFELRMAKVPDGVLILSIDITDRKNLERQVRRAQRMDAVGQLAGGVAHDFNNILTIIQNYATFVQEELGADHEAHEDVDCVLDAARRGADLTRKLLAFARQTPIAPEVVEVGPALGELDRLLGRVLGEDIVVDTSTDDVGSILVDRSSLDQILVNLAINARDAMGGGGTLTVETAEMELDADWGPAHGLRLGAGPYVVVSVTDTGTGIPRDKIDRIFEPFFTTKERGTGLGLATCWGLVEQAGGTMTVYSEEGVGTTFRLYFPRVTAREAARRQAPPPRPGKGERVLVVEDEAQVRSALARVLRDRGYKVIEAATAAEALLLVEDVGDRLDLIVTDVVMPRMSGIELSERVRRRHPKLAVLLVSGFAPRSLGPSGLGPDLHVLTKPFTPDALLEAVRRALGLEPS